MLIDHLARKTQLIACAVLGDVLGMGLRKLLNSLINRNHATRNPHGLGGEVGVGTSAYTGQRGMR